VAKLKKLDFALSGEAMNLLKPGSCYPSLEDAEVLFGINIKWFFIYRIISVRLVLKDVCGEKVWEEVMLWEEI
jgi:hypothetical protein